MAGERNVEEVVEKGRIPILRGAFIEPNRFRDALEPLGISLGSEDPIGVLDAKTIEGELKRMDVVPRFSRQAARAIANELRGNQIPRLFSPGSGLTIESGRVGDERFYRRSDLSDEAAHKRLGAYQILLIEEAERIEREKAENTAEKEAERTRPSTAVIRIMTTFTLDKYQENVKELAAKATGRQVVEEIPHDIEGGIEPVARVIQRPDARKILESGLDRKQFTLLLEAVRAGIVESTGKDEERNARTAAEILEVATKRIEKPGQDVDMPIYFPRDVYEMIYYQMKDLNQNPNIAFEVEVEESRIGATEPLPRHVAKVWSGRFDEDVLPDHLDGIKAANAEIGETVELALLADNSPQILRALRLGEDLSVDGKVVKREELSKILEPLVLNDKVIAQVIFADLVGEVYPMPYHTTLRGELREIGLNILRYVAEGLSVAQVQEALAPHVVEREVPQIATVQRQLAGIEEQIQSIKGSDRSANQRRQALEKQRAQLAKRLDGLEKQRVVRTPNNSIVQQVVEERLLTEAPKPKDYGNGEDSVGYKIAVKHHELRQESNPEEAPPTPDDYILEDESDGFRNATNLYEAYQTIIPEGWVKRWKGGESAAKTYEALKKMVVPALLPEGVYTAATIVDKPEEDPMPDFDISKLKNIPGLPL